MSIVQILAKAQQILFLLRRKKAVRRSRKYLSFMGKTNLFDTIQIRFKYIKKKKKTNKQLATKKPQKQQQKKPHKKQRKNNKNRTPNKKIKEKLQALRSNLGS